MTNQLHLAQVNIARMKAPLDSPVMAGFVARLDEINALADRSPGFVWRLQTGEGNAISALMTTTEYCSTSRCGRASSTFVDTSYLALWWVPIGHRPSIDEAKKRLAYLAENGPTSFAFTFKISFPPDPAVVEATDWSAFEPCPAV
jgi:Domain of unknown function (DUF3291)